MQFYLASSSQNISDNQVGEHLCKASTQGPEQEGTKTRALPRPPSGDADRERSCSSDSAPSFSHCSSVAQNAILAARPESPQSRLLLNFSFKKITHLTSYPICKPTPPAPDSGSEATSFTPWGLQVEQRRACKAGNIPRPAGAGGDASAGSLPTALPARAEPDDWMGREGYNMTPGVAAPAPCTHSFSGGSAHEKELMKVHNLDRSDMWPKDPAE
ncbi:hypothetical protein HJG60_011599 [Phyllostomus discolor]|uniref:Uncharacterized protein n=1 Tax=Phyllostomus discolor TaxID=89673 RepID=A0A834E0Y9_9CHIR|nr:hypothetical protein HJG60_011599 [Phyllostomus discolor]